MMNAEHKPRTLVLGIGNLLMGDEGVGVHVIRALESYALGDDVECMDGGTGGFHLLGPLSDAERVIIIDAAANDQPIGTVTRTEPRFSADYPRTLTAHDIGLKDMLDAFYISGEPLYATLFAITISPQQGIGMELSHEVSAAVPVSIEAVLRELSCERSQ
jgi:hydrogenase maturation protease